MKQRRLIGGNAARGQLSESGIDAVSRNIGEGRFRDDVGGRLDARPEGRIEHDGPPCKHLRQVVEADASGRNDNRGVPIVHCPLHTRPYNGLKPIR